MPYLSAPRRVPWSSWSQWMQAYEALRAPSTHAADIPHVCEWAARGHVPLAVVLTQQLSTWLRDADSRTRDEAMLRLAGAMLVVRLVNGFADSGQTGMFAASVADVAMRIGMPRWFVDVRHEAAHGALPSLAALRMLCSRALQWLFQVYWEMQAQACREHLYKDPVDRTDPLVQLLAAYAASAAHAGNQPATDGSIEPFQLFWDSRGCRLVWFEVPSRQGGAGGGGGGAARRAAKARRARDARLAGVQPAALQHLRRLVDHITAKLADPIRRHNWLRGLFLPLLVRHFLIAPGRSAHASYRLWLPLLWLLQRSTPAVYRLLMLELSANLSALVTPPSGGSSEAADRLAAWLLLLCSRYWHSLFDWRLAERKGHLLHNKATWTAGDRRLMSALLPGLLVGLRPTAVQARPASRRHSPQAQLPPSYEPDEAVDDVIRRVFSLLTSLSQECGPAAAALVRSMEEAGAAALLQASPAGYAADQGATDMPDDDHAASAATSLVAAPAAAPTAALSLDDIERMLAGLPPATAGAADSAAVAPAAVRPQPRRTVRWSLAC